MFTCTNQNPNMIDYKCMHFFLRHKLRCSRFSIHFFLFFANICFSKFETIVFEKIISIAACELEKLSSTRSIYEHIALPSYYIHGMAFGIKRPYQ